MTRCKESRLAYLMTSMGVTGKELADVLHVDYSLVSKWRNHSRRLSARSNHLAGIARYILSLDEAANYLHVRRALRSNYENIDDIPYETLLIYLCRWLTETPPFEKENAIVSADKSHNMYTSKFDVYRGNHGRRCAVLRFLDHVLTMPEGQQLFLLSQEDMSWLIEDPVFLKEWRTKLAEVLLKKNNITIIHTVDREFRDLTSILSQWLPLHMSGRIKSYFHPRYVDSLIKSTLFILKDSVAVTGIIAEGKGDHRYTGYFTDPSTVSQSEAIFESFLSTCRPLLTAHPTSPTNSFLKALAKADSRLDNAFLYLDLPMATSMSRETLVKVLEKNRVNEESVRVGLAYFDSAQESFAKNVASFRIRHAYCPEALERATLDDEPPIYPDLSLICQCEVKVSREHFAEHLSNICRLMKEHDNFEVALVTGEGRGSFKNISLWIKENGLVVASTMNAQKHGPFAVMAEEVTIINAFCLFYQNLWNSLPRPNKDKLFVIERLKGLVKL